MVLVLVNNLIGTFFRIIDFRGFEREHRGLYGGCGALGGWFIDECFVLIFDPLVVLSNPGNGV